MYQKINVFRYPFWRALDRNLVICAISPVILINRPCSEYLVKSLSLRKRIKEEDKGGEVLLERYVGI